jgi:hypothetical protein
MIAQPTEQVIERGFHLIGSAIDCHHQVAGVVRDRGWLMPLETRFHHAALVVIAAFAAVGIAEMDFDAGNLLAEAAERVLHDRFDLRSEFFAARDVVVGVYEDLHDL